MAFKYLNPGYGSWLGDSDVVTIENNFTYNPEHGVSFQKVATNTYNETRIPLPQAFTSDIYGKFNLYYDYGNSQIRYFALGATVANSNDYFYNNCIGIRINNNIIQLASGRGSITDGSSYGIYYNVTTLNQIQFHVHIGDSASTSYGKIIVNDREFYGTNASSIANFSSAKYFSINFLTSSNHGDKLYISELMISDEPISPKERIIILPTTSTDTDMSAGESGIFIANAANQTLLQGVDTSMFSAEYGADSKVTSVALHASPAYKTATGLASLIGISKSGGSVAEHNTFDLSTDTGASVQDSWTFDDMTIGDLQNMQFGWQAGT